MANMLERNKKTKVPQKTRAEHYEDALYREVWEEVNNEKTMRFIKKYSTHIMTAVICIMLVVTGIQIGVRAHNSKKLATATAYEMAIQNSDANALAALAENTSGATADLALFQAYLIDKDINKLDTLAQNGNTRDFRDLAKLHIIAARGDQMSGDDVKKYLDDMTTKSSPFYYTACLTIAQKYLSVGDTDAANIWLDKIINDADAPASISGTAQTLR